MGVATKPWVGPASLESNDPTIWPLLLMPKAKVSMGGEGPTNGLLPEFVRDSHEPAARRR
jgi:hypothetical protein